MKTRLLFCGEASWLSTGFAVISKELIKRLHATGKYDIAEYGAYGRVDDARALALPWRFYGTLPTTVEEEQIYNSKPTNQFGEYKFDAVVADFQPDICIDFRDPWMFQHMMRSRFKGLFKTIIVPTVDSAPQKKEWIEQLFKPADILGAYSRYGKKVLENDGLKVSAVISPAVNLEVFKPLNKKQIRETWGIRPKTLVIGTVMRNQKRKLFPDLFEAFSQLRKRHSDIPEVERSVLLCHTSWPDVGWDIPDLLERNALMRHVIFTYKCDSCTKIFLSWFLPSDGVGRGRCIFCGNQTARMPTTHNGISENELAQIYNLMDIYVQPAICEGWGMPIVEAKACGVPGLYSNYSAMEDHVENGGGLGIDIGRRYTESETMAIRTLPSIEDMILKFKRLLTNKVEREKLGRKAHEVALKMHTWDIAANELIRLIDSVPAANRKLTWQKRPETKLIPNGSLPANLPDNQFVAACYTHILGRQPDEPGFRHWMERLSKGGNRKDVENYFRNEVEMSNRFESIRYIKSLQNAGFDTSKEVFIDSNRLPGVTI
jgi:glycosyltransferase involved in cell wall biosynthesis